LFVRLGKNTAVRAVLDHDHTLPTQRGDNSRCGRVRGTISQAANVFLGYLEKYYNKYCVKYTDLSLPEVLRNIADYLEQDISKNPLHHIEINKQKKRLMRRRKDSLARELNAAGYSVKGLDKKTLVVLYCDKLILPLYGEG
jgi:hypothetical protein